MKILFEDSIPYGREYFSELGEVVAYHWQTLMPEALKDVDVLAIRSTTKITPALLQHANKLKFVTTATAGINHIDKNYLDAQGILWNSAAGCNAVAVAEYVLSTILLAHKAKKLSVENITVGIVGAGNVGTALSGLLRAANIPYLLCDPPLQEAGDSRELVDMSRILTCDVITLHVPFVDDGPHSTGNLIDEEALAGLNENQLLINACRGEVINENALLTRLEQTDSPTVVLDVFDNEPNINPDALTPTWLVSPHIAGHSVEGKVRGTQMVYEQICDFAGITPSKRLSDFLSAPAPIAFQLSNPSAERLSADDMVALLLAVYNVSDDDKHFRQQVAENKLSIGETFAHSRKHYRTRRECSAYTLTIDDKTSTGIRHQLHALGFTLS